VTATQTHPDRDNQPAWDVPDVPGPADLRLAVLDVAAALLLTELWLAATVGSWRRALLAARVHVPAW
jgi:hypothetical protein